MQILGLSHETDAIPFDRAITSAVEASDRLTGSKLIATETNDCIMQVVWNFTKGTANIQIKAGSYHSWGPLLISLA